MAIIKCKMCGGDLNLVEGSTVCECEYCGTKQTVPSADNEKKLTLFGRAGRLLRGCEFDKAAGVFETIVADFPQEAEAYWGLVLCKYGIEYVDDPATGKKIPTCHRSSFDSVMDDANFEQACENTDAVARRVYRDEARQIEELRQAILQVSGKEEPYDVFISYKETDENGERTLDSVIAQDIYKELTDEGYRVFFSRISLEDKLGTEYEPYIFAALNSAKVMLVVGTDYENFDSVWVKNEWSRFLKLIAKGEKKTLIPVFKNMDVYDMPKEFAKLSAQDMGKVGAMQDLVRGVEKIVGKKKTEPVKETVVVQQGGGPNVTALLKRGQQALEDNNWDKAKSFYDQVLSMDAENAEAYLGLALADAKCANENTYISRRCGIRPEQEKKSLFPDRERVAAAVQSHVVPGFLNEDEIRDLFRFDLVYYSDVKGTEKIAEQEKTVFRNNRNLTRALRFAKDETKVRMDRFQSTLFSRLDNNVEKAKQREAAAKDEKAKAYEAHLAAAEQKLVELHHQAEINREGAYQYACKKQAAAKTIVEYKSAIRAFQRVEGYLDSDKRTAQCRTAIEEIKEQERQRKEAEAKEAAEEAERKRKAEAEEAERQRILKEKADKERKAKNKKIGIVVGILAAVAVVAFLVVTKVVIPNSRYKAAEALFDSGEYEEAKNIYLNLNGFKESTAKIEICENAIKEENARREEELRKQAAKKAEEEARIKEEEQAKKYSEVETLVERGELYQAAVSFYNLGDYRDAKQRSFDLWGTITTRNTIAANANAVVAINNEGQILATSNTDLNDQYTDIIALAGGGNIVIGLRSNGTVVPIINDRFNQYGQLNVTDWMDIVAVDTGGWHSVGLKADGTVVATKNKEFDYGQSNVSDWTGIAAVSAGPFHTVGLKTDGTVVAVGDNKLGQCDMSGWTEVVAVATGEHHTVGLKADGTVVAVGDNKYGQCNVSGWTDIVAISAKDDYTVGLKADGTVIAIGDNKYGQCNVSGMNNIACVLTTTPRSVGLRNDGTMIVTDTKSAWNYYDSMPSVIGWTNIKLPNT